MKNNILLNIVSRSIHQSIYSPILHLQDAFDTNTEDKITNSLYVTDIYYQRIHNTPNPNRLVYYRDKSIKCMTLTEIKAALQVKEESINDILRTVNVMGSMTDDEIISHTKVDREPLTEEEVNINHSMIKDWNDALDTHKGRLGSPLLIQGKIISQGNTYFVQGSSQDYCEIDSLIAYKAVVDRLSKELDEVVYQIESIEDFIFVEEDGGILNEVAMFISVLHDNIVDAVGFELTDTEFIEYLRSIIPECTNNYFEVNPKSPFLTEIVSYDILKMYNNNKSTVTLNYFEVFIDELLYEMNKSVVSKKNVFADLKNTLGIDVHTPSVKSRVKYEHRTLDRNAMNTNLRNLADATIQSQVVANAARREAGKAIASSINHLSDATLGITTEDQENKIKTMNSRAEDQYQVDKRNTQANREHQTRHANKLIDIGLCMLVPYHYEPYEINKYLRGE